VTCGELGWKSTLGINHAVVCRTLPPQEAQVVAIKQICASPYFQTACVPRPNGQGFHLVTLKASRQVGLTGFKGRLLRKIVEQKTRSGQEEALMGVRKALEAK